MGAVGLLMNSLASRPRSLDGAKPRLRPVCHICAGGWPNYWRAVLSGEPAGVCEAHEAENAASSFQFSTTPDDAREPQANTGHTHVSKGGTLNDY